MKALVVVPAYNEGATIASVLTAVRGSTHDVVVIDDGSTDTTAAIANACGAPVVQHCVNRGLGAALRTGFRYACDAGYEVVLTLDADGQHDPHEISRLLRAIDDGADVVIGRRDSLQMPTVRQLYNALGAALTSGLFGGPLRDSQSGFRALRTAALRNFDLKTSRMEISSEIIAECHRLQLVVAEVPITVRYTEYSMSKGQSLFEGARTAWRLVLKSFL